MRSFSLALFLLSLVPATVFADPSPIISPLATARPVIARHGMVVTQEAEASRVGLDILQRGGNAIDAAVAVGFALAVTLPRAGNIGGGGFMLIHRADLNQTIAIDYRECAPAATTKGVFLDANGQADPFKSRYSGVAVGVPGRSLASNSPGANTARASFRSRTSSRLRSRSRVRGSPSMMMSPTRFPSPPGRWPAAPRRRACFFGPTAT